MLVRPAIAISFGSDLGGVGCFAVFAWLNVCWSWASDLSFGGFWMDRDLSREPESPNVNYA